MISNLNNDFICVYSILNYFMKMRCKYYFTLWKLITKTKWSWFPVMLKNKCFEEFCLSNKFRCKSSAHEKDDCYLSLEHSQQFSQWTNGINWLQNQFFIWLFPKKHTNVQPTYILPLFSLCLCLLSLYGRHLKKHVILCNAKNDVGWMASLNLS